MSVQHLNIPPQIRPVGKVQKLRLRVHLFFWKLKWMLVIVIAPECLLGKALVDLLAAWWACDEMTKLAKEDVVEWSATHAYYANMGGFGVRFDESTRAAEAKIVVNDAPEGDCAGVRQQRYGNNITTATGGDTTLQKESITPLYRNSRLLAS